MWPRRGWGDSGRIRLDERDGSAAEGDRNTPPLRHGADPTTDDPLDPPRLAEGASPDRGAEEDDGAPGHSPAENDPEEDEGLSFRETMVKEPWVAVGLLLVLVFEALPILAFGLVIAYAILRNVFGVPLPPLPELP